MEKNDFKEICAKGFDSKWWAVKAAKNCRGIGVERALDDCRKALIGKDGLPTKVTDGKRINAQKGAYLNLEKALKNATKKCGVFQKNTEKGIKLYLFQIKAGKRKLDEIQDKIQHEIERHRKLKERGEKPPEALEIQLKPIDDFARLTLKRLLKIGHKRTALTGPLIDIEDLKGATREEKEAELNTVLPQMNRRMKKFFSVLAKMEAEYRPQEKKFKAIVKRYPGQKKTWGGTQGRMYELKISRGEAISRLRILKDENTERKRWLKKALKKQLAATGQSKTRT